MSDVGPVPPTTNTIILKLIYIADFIHISTEMLSLQDGVSGEIIL